MDLLFDYPPATAYGKTVPKSRVASAGKASARVRRALTDAVANIRWSHKLAPETLNLPARTGGELPVAEVQVFRVKLKDPAAGAAPLEVLACIDRAVPSPIVFEVIAGERVCVAAAVKRPSAADGARHVAGELFTTVWTPGNALRVPLPVAADLGLLYEQVLRRLIPVSARPGETVVQQAQRAGQLGVVGREVARLEAAVTREKQFNRKVELNGVLQEQRAAYERLRAGGG